MEEKLIELYCTICQCNDSRFIEGKQRLSNNNCPQFSDEELITVYLWGKAQQLLTRKAIYKYKKPFAGIVPRNPQLSGILPQAEPSGSSFSRFGGNMDRAGRSKRRRYPPIRSRFLSHYGSQTFL